MDDKQIVDFLTYKARNNKFLRGLREFKDYYEYEVIRDYEERFDIPKVYTVAVGDVYASIVETGGKLVLVGIIFSKEGFSLDQVVTFLENYGVVLAKELKVKNALSVIDGLRFKGETVILYLKGNKTIDISDQEFRDITEEAISLSDYVDTNTSKPVLREEALVIFIHNEGESIKYGVKDFETIYFAQEDVVICNGTRLLVDYMEIYQNTLGFFRGKGELVAFVGDSETEVHIISEEIFDGAYLFEIGYNYLIDIEE